MKYHGTNFIENDLKRNKNISAETDIKDAFMIVKGKFAENGLYVDKNDYIGEKILNNSKIIFYKRRIPISKPKIKPSQGGRLIYGIIEREKGIIFIPFLFFLANEEKKFYKINGKKIRLTSSYFVKIIDEKLKLIK